MQKEIITIPLYCNGQTFNIDFDIHEVYIDKTKPLFLLDCYFNLENRPTEISVINLDFNTLFGIELCDGSSIISCHFVG